MQALQDVTYQVTLGPRTIGSTAHQQVIDWASDELEEAGWEVSHQSFNWASHTLTNIIASRGKGSPWILIGAHYDSRFISDQDPDPKKQNIPVPGANDGASGVAVLLEIARSLPLDLDKQIWIVLFDAEDNGTIPGWEWIIGSRVFAANLSEYPDSVVIIDMVGDAANLPHQERLLNPFFVSRNNGIQYRQFLLNNRMTISGGWYNKWPFNGRSFAESPNTFTARITGLPKWEKNGKQFMHTGIAVRYAEADNNTLRLKGKNESNVSTNYVDTKNFEGTHQWNLGIEQLWSLENFSVLMEYVHNWSKATTGTEQFRGYYITSSYIISGEQRPYDMKAAYARRVKPDNKSGAWEVWFRIGRVNLDSRNIKGGINSRGTLGLNWWASQSWKLGFNYGISNLLKDESIGITNSFQWRIQWIL